MKGDQISILSRNAYQFEENFGIWAQTSYSLATKKDPISDELFWSRNLFGDRNIVCSLIVFSQEISVTNVTTKQNWSIMMLGDKIWSFSHQLCSSLKRFFLVVNQAFRLCKMTLNASIVVELRLKQRFVRVMVDIYLYWFICVYII